MCVVNVGVPSPEGLISLTTTEFTLEKTHMNVDNVGCIFIKRLSSLTTTDFTLERRHMNVMMWEVLQSTVYPHTIPQNLQ